MSFSISVSLWAQFTDRFNYSTSQNEGVYRRQRFCWTLTNKSKTFETANCDFLLTRLNAHGFVKEPIHMILRYSCNHQPRVGMFMVRWMKRLPKEWPSNSLVFWHFQGYRNGNSFLFFEKLHRRYSAGF